jgi:hypothetical protein
MKMSRLVSALCVLVPALAWSNPIHNVWATTPMYVADTAGWYNATTVNSSFGWNEATGYAFGNARATVGTNVYEFQLTSVTASTTSGQIIGTWNVTKNNVVICGNCQGSAYGLDGGVGNYYKIYVGPNNAFHLSAGITNAYNY